MEIIESLTELEQMVAEARSMPLSASVLISREEFLEVIGRMQEQIPQEIEQARWVIKDRDQLLEKARADAEKIVEDAREKQLRMARKEEIVQTAREEAERLFEEAADEARKLKTEAEDYADARLAQFEIAMRRILEDTQASYKVLSRTLDQVEAGRERLRTTGTHADQMLSPETHRTSGPELYDLEEDIPQE